ncbi:MAG: sigma-70 family RNA polymerase sigma factor [Phycisphaera sp.]|nr:sigma-70 family RNA polymerase sigma factor [Phycisphaera sp.]
MAVEHDTVVRTLLKERAKVLAYVWAIVRDNHLAEDVYQDVSIAAINKRDEIESVDHLLGWLRAAARFKSLEALRKARRQPMTFDDDVLDMLEGAWGDRDRDDAGERLDALKSCMEKLTPYTRRLVELRYGLGMSGVDVAKYVSRDVRTVYMALTRTHNSLRECVRQRIDGPDPSGEAEVAGA